MLSKDKMLLAIAKENGIRLNDNDPIMVLVTMLIIFQEQQEIAQAELLQQYHSELSELSNKWEADANSKAKQIIDSSIKAGTKTITNAIESSTTANKAAIKDVIEQTLETYRETIDKGRNQNNTVAIANIASSLMLTISVLTFLLFQ
ncbi:hypothetical protein [Pseudoalteromonas galatheae]|uniref:hypothetical protein n=1 Tax=Pseudoalteromonas galatheae TaxID=579562 RepID=UPI0030D5F60A